VRRLTKELQRASWRVALGLCACRISCTASLSSSSTAVSSCSPLPLHPHTLPMAARYCSTPAAPQPLPGPPRPLLVPPHARRQPVGLLLRRGAW